MNDYLGKPVEEKELVRILNLYLGFEVNEKQRDTTLINFKQIQGITGNNKELMNIMLQKAIEAMPDELEQLHQSIKEKKYVQSREKAHTMCSTLGLMGAPEEAMLLTRKIQGSSDAAFANDSVLQHYYQLHSIVEKLMVQIRHYLAA